MVDDIRRYSHGRWIWLFIIDIAAGLEIISLTAAKKSLISDALRLLLVVFLLDIALLYRWAKKDPYEFIKSNWFWIITVIPWFRPLRMIRVVRGARILRVLTGTRRIGALINKLRRTIAKVIRKLGE